MTFKVTGIVYIGSVHHKNLESLERDCLQYKIKLVRIHNVYDCKNHPDCNLFWSFSEFINPKEIPVHMKILYGPHLFVLPEGTLALKPTIESKEWAARCCFVTPSDWVIGSYNECGGLPIPMKALPFSVNLKQIAKTEAKGRTNVFIYSKARHPEDLNYVTEILNKKSINYRIFSYGSYTHSDYLAYLQTCKYGIWVGSHESQGFGLLEALASNVPLVVWDVTSMHQEFSGGRYTYYYLKPKLLLATSAEYWDNNCGIKFYQAKEFENSLNHMEKSSGGFKPREYVESVLSGKMFIQSLENIVESISKKINS